MLDLRLHDQAVDRIGRFTGDRHRVRTREHRTDQIGCGGLGYIYGALIERGDHLVGATRDRNEVELDLLAGEESFLLGDSQIERRHASYGRRNLPVPERHGVSGRGCDRDTEPRRNDRLARNIARHLPALSDPNLDRVLVEQRSLRRLSRRAQATAPLPYADTADPRTARVKAMAS